MSTVRVSPEKRSPRRVEDVVPGHDGPPVSHNSFKSSKLLIGQLHRMPSPGGTPGAGSISSRRLQNGLGLGPTPSGGAPAFTRAWSSMSEGLHLIVVRPCSNPYQPASSAVAGG
jgi:hypothetical protein